MKEKKKIIICSHALEIGGVERSLIDLLNCINYDFVEVDLFLYRHSGEWMNSIPDNVRLLPEIRQYLDQGKTVLVSVEADWCLTCKFNDVTVLDTAALKDTFRSFGVKVIEIDWTNYNAEVLAFMEEFGRKGLPFYIIFSPKIPNGMVLPEILNNQDLIEIIKNISIKEP